MVHDNDQLPAHATFRELAGALAKHPQDRAFVFAQINDLLSGLDPDDLCGAVAAPPRRSTPTWQTM